MKQTFLIILLSFITLLSAAFHPAALAQGANEKPSVRSASQVLPPELRAGPQFSVDDEVSSNGYLDLFTVHSEFGDFSAVGFAGLRVRLVEINALSQLKEFTDTKVFMDAAQSAGVNMVMAPVEGVKAVAGAVTDPGATWSKLKKAPAGIVGFFGDAADEVGSVAGSVTGGGGGAESEEDLGDKAKDEATSQALSYSGYNKREAAWYQRIGIDPYTDNKVLRDRITRIAGVSTAVNFGFKFVPGIPGLSGIGTAAKALKMADNLAVYADPKELRDRNGKLLAEIGIDRETIKLFLGSKVMTPTQQAFMVEAIARLRGVPGIAEFLRMAAQVKTRHGGAIYVRAVRYVAAKHQAGAAYTGLLSISPLPAACAKDGGIIVPLPMDYLYWTGEVAKVFSNFRLTAEKKYAPKRIELQIEGSLTPRARRELTELKYVVNERVKL